MNLLLAIILIAQQPGSLVDNIDRTPPPDPSEELARWLRRPAPRKPLEAAKWDRLIDAMGSRYSRIRELAQRDLYRRIKERPGEGERLAYGLQHRDAEIRMRSGAIVRSLWSCRRCGGLGELPPSIWTGDGLPERCWACRGSGIDLTSAGWLARDIRR